MGCPSLEEINGILQEEESSSRLQDFMSHLGSCRRCQFALSELSELPMDNDIGDIFTSGRKKRPPEQFEEPSSSFGIIPQEKKSRIGPLRIDRKIGEGGMAEVFACYDERTDRMVAVKVIDSTVINSRNLERLEQEARIHAQLKHPNVVSLLGFDIDNGLPYLVMELVEGGTLKELLKNRSIKPRQLAEIMRGVALAVQAAHDLKILHRDLKPANILLQRLSRSGSREASSFSTGSSLIPKVTDFGLAKLTESDTNLSKSAMYLGTPSYMSPEQTVGDSKRIKEGADIYSMGVILYEGLTGRLPFVGEDLTELFGRIRHSIPIPPSELVAGVPHDLEIICLKCLEKDPKNRYESAAKMAEDLTRYLDGIPIVAKPTGPIGKLFRLARLYPYLAISAVLIVGNVLTFVFWTIISADRETEARKRAELVALRLDEEAKVLRSDYGKLQSHFLFAIDQAHRNSTRLGRLISEGSKEPELRKFQRELTKQRGELGERVLHELEGNEAFDPFLVQANYLSGINKQIENDHPGAIERFKASAQNARGSLASGNLSMDTRYYALRSLNLLAEYDIARDDFPAALEYLQEAWDSYASHGEDYVLTRAVKAMSLQTAFRMNHCLLCLGRADEARIFEIAIEQIKRVPVRSDQFDIDILY